MAEPEATEESATSADADSSPLLEVQRLDTEIEQLRHRRVAHPLYVELGVARTERDACRQRIDEMSVRRDGILIRQSRLEGEAAAVEAAADAKGVLLYSGEVRGLKDLEALQNEVEGLRSRQEVFEEQAIEALLEADEMSDEISLLNAEFLPLDERVTVLETELAAVVDDIDMRLSAAEEEHEAAVAALGTEVFAVYESLRPLFGHCTVVSFDVASGCGCPSRMPVAEIARIRRCETGAVLTCSECGRMVLR